MHMSVSSALHILAAVVWVGGMFFAYFALRPASAALEPPQRCRLWRAVLGRFFGFVWVAVAVLVLTGYGMLFATFGGMRGAGLHIHLMQGVGLVMMALFAHVWFAPFAALKRAVADEDWPLAGKQIARIRTVVALNLALGLLVVIVASGGRWL
jgi:uncharacterized membrane protein